MFGGLSPTLANPGDCGRCYTTAIHSTRRQFADLEMICKCKYIGTFSFPDLTYQVFYLVGQSWRMMPREPPSTTRPEQRRFRLCIRDLQPLSRQILAKSPSDTQGLAFDGSQRSTKGSALYLTSSHPFVLVASSSYPTSLRQFGAPILLRTATGCSLPIMAWVTARGS